MGRYDHPLDVPEQSNLDVYFRDGRPSIEVRVYGFRNTDGRFDDVELQVLLQHDGPYTEYWLPWRDVEYMEAASRPGAGGYPA